MNTPQKGMAHGHERALAEQHRNTARFRSQLTVSVNLWR